MRSPVCAEYHILGPAVAKDYTVYIAQRSGQTFDEKASGGAAAPVFTNMSVPGI